MKVNKIIYWIATVLMAAQFSFSAMMYFVKHNYIKSAYINLGFPIWIIHPLATAKIFALTVILIRQSKVLKEWAYAGLFFNALLAFFAHLMIQDGQYVLPAVALITILTSRIFEDKMFKVVKV